MRIFFISILILSGIVGKGQTFWFRHPGGLGNDEALDLTRDPMGHSIATGYFTQGVDFSPSVTLYTSSASDIFIASYDASGNLLWARQAGGPGADRGLSVRTDNMGNIYVTGYFFGSANFGPFALTATAGSQDVFVAKLDASGNFLWARAFGGEGADLGNGITADQDGNAIVTGQYKGTSDFGSGFSFTSMVNPTTGLSTYDIFVAKLDVSGTTSWVKPAQAKYDDRGMDVDCDATGNIYVTGQFSDTITIDLAHNNIVLNAGTVFKLDPAGNETGFCRITSGQTVPYSIDVDVAGQVNICGDYTGSMVIDGPPPIFVPSTASKNIFIARFNSSLQVIWTAHAGSGSEVTARSITTSADGSVFIAGMFKCRFDDYGDHFGPSMFYSIGYRDVFAAQYNNTGNYVWSKNAGGPKDDLCGGIVLSDDGLPVLAGGMNEEFSFVAVPGIFSEVFSDMVPCPSIGQDYVTTQGTVPLKNAFIGGFMDLSNNVTDVFERYPDCSSDFPEPVLVLEGQDTVHYCTPHNLVTDTRCWHPLCSVGACFDFTWQDGSHLPTHYANTNGWFYVTITREDMCYSNTDSVYFELDPVAPPLITDSYGINTLHPLYALPITICGSDTITLTAGNVEDSGFSGWTDATGGGFHEVNDSTIQIYHSDTYYFSNVNAYGCSASNHIVVLMDTFALTDTLHPFIQLSDTVNLCSSYTYFSAALVDSQYFHGYIMPNKNVDWYLDMITPSPYNTSHTTELQLFHAVSTGWHHIYAHLINPCAEDTVNYWVEDSVYININTGPVITYTFEAGTYQCPYDTVYHTFYTNVSAVSISSSCAYHAQTDSAIITVGPGTTYVNMYAVDPVTGCSSFGAASFTVPPYPMPLVQALPSNAVVCPGDSVLLTVTEGVDYDWVGPDVFPNAQNVYASSPGFYFCVVTDSNGCVLSSNVIETNEYGTPYLEASPGTYFCEGESVTLTANASPGASYAWEAPLSGSGSIMTVSEGGVYACNVTSCGIVTHALIELIETHVPVVITAPDTLLCAGDTIVLHANTGMSEYEWSPGGETDTVIYVTTPGTYTLTEMLNGCYKSASVEVLLSPSPPDPVIADTAICPGNAVSLSVAGSATVNWYDSTGIFLVSGSTYTTPVLTASTMYFVQSTDIDVCPGALVPVEVTMAHDSTPELFFNGHCMGDDLSLFSNVPGTAVFHWSGPAGFASSVATPVISNAGVSNTGIYAMYYSSAPGCISDTGFVTVHLLPPPFAHINGMNTTWCQGDWVVFSAVDSSGYLYNWFFSPVDSVTGNNAGIVIETDMSTVVLEVTDMAGCRNTDTVDLHIKPLPVIGLSGLNEVCLGDPLLLTATANQYDSIMLSGPGGLDTSTLSYLIPVTGLNHSGTYTFTASYDGCTDSVMLAVIVGEHPFISLGQDTGICSGSTLVYHLPAGFAYTWSNGSTTGSVEISAGGVYWVIITDSLNCITYDTLVVELLACDLGFPNIFTPNGDGINDYFRPFTEGMTSLDLLIFNRWGTLLFETHATDGYWDGVSANGDIASPGVYFYIAKAGLKNGELVDTHGHFQLNR